MNPLRLSALFVGLLERDAPALCGRFVLVPVERVAARKEVPAAFAEGDLQRVRLRRVAVPLEVFPRPERRVGTAPALDLANRATCPVGLRGREQRLVPRLELSRELEVLVLRFLCVVVVAAAAAAPVPAAPAPPPHSPQPKSALRPQFVSPAPAGNLVPARVDGEFPARSGSRASPLRVPPPWVHY